MSKSDRKYKSLMYKKIENIKAIIIILYAIAIISAVEIFTLNKMSANLKNLELSEETEEYIDLETAKNSGTGIIYYISANGTSKEGTDINEPMSLTTAKSKKYKGNDKVLFKSGDTFYGMINFNVSIIEDDFFYIGSYGEGEKPIISGAKIVEDIWNTSEEGIYTIDLSVQSNFKGYKGTSTNIGFIADSQGNIYGYRKKEKDLLENEMDFYIENDILYLKCSENPYEKYGILKFATRDYLIYIPSNTIIENLDMQYTGGHGIVPKSTIIKNACIKNCILQNIGGSVQIESTFTRYGNGIEFWNQATNTLVENCIIRNIYDAGYTTQGNTVDEKLGFKNNICKDNIFINCTYDVEMFCRNDNDKNAICNLLLQQVYNNISINQGRGWGFNVRPGKSTPSTYVIWNMQKDNTSVKIENNKYYNPLRLDYIHIYSIKPDLFKSGVTSDNNTWYISEDTYMINDSTDRGILDEYGIEANSTFNIITEEQLELINNQEILNSNDYNEIKQYYEHIFDENNEDDEWVIEKEQEDNEQVDNEQDIVVSDDEQNKQIKEIKSNNNYKVENNYIKNITYKTSQTELQEKLDTNIDYTIQRNGQTLDTNKNIATGDILKTSDGEEYTLIVTGDVTKDGNVDIKDIVELRTYLLEGDNLDEIELIAADCNNDGKDITIKDWVQMRTMVLSMSE